MNGFQGIGWLMMALLGMWPRVAFPQTDTLELRGHRFVMVHAKTTADWETESVSLRRLDAAPQQVLLRHTTKEFIGDCNSLTVELGAYRVTDTTITFYTAWTYDHENRFPVGVRKQVYRITAAGLVLPLQAEIHLKVCPECEDYAYYLNDDPANPDHEARRAWQLYFACYDTHYQARWIDAKPAKPLYREVRQVLGPALEAAYRTNPALQRL